jgi:hypothetical protein
MSALSPAQLVLVLWLLTAAAPAATALVNGSLGAWLPVGVECQAKPESRATSVEKKAREEMGDVVRSTAGTFRAVVASFVVENGVQPALAVSLLHTELQRHRPKVA